MHGQTIVKTNLRRQFLFGFMGPPLVVLSLLYLKRNTRTAFSGAVQNYPTSAQVIYDTLAADATFLGLLGEYNFKSGTGPVTALSVVSAGEDLPSIRNVSGVECIIQDAGNTQAQNYLTDAPDYVTTWSLFLVAWEPSKGADLQIASERILSRFVGAESVQTVATTDGLGSLVQTKVFIKSNMPIRPL